jgi:hypothetical protein
VLRYINVMGVEADALEAADGVPRDEKIERSIDPTEDD